MTYIHTTFIRTHESKWKQHVSKSKPNESKWKQDVGKWKQNESNIQRTSQSFQLAKPFASAFIWFHYAFMLLSFTREWLQRESDSKPKQASQEPHYRERVYNHQLWTSSYCGSWALVKGTLCKLHGIYSHLCDFILHHLVYRDGPSRRQSNSPTERLSILWTALQKVYLYGELKPPTRVTKLNFEEYEDAIHTMQTAHMLWVIGDLLVSQACALLSAVT